MSSLKIRPRFKEELPIGEEEFRTRLQTALDNTDDFTGLVSEKYCTVKVPLEKRHYWSPQLTLTIQQLHDDEHPWVRGLYGPRPSVWAVFFISYAALGVLSLFVGVFGISLLMLDKPAPILWAIPGFAAIALVLYFVAQAGQKVGSEQMFRIHHFYESVMGRQVSIK